MDEHRRGALISKTWLHDDLKLIEIIKKYPDLYSATTRRNRVIDELWETVALEMGVPPQRCFTRWRRMRAYYIRLSVDPNPSTKNSKFLDGTLSFIDPTVRCKTWNHTSSFRSTNSSPAQKIETSDVPRQKLREPLKLMRITNPCDISLMDDPESLIPAAKISAKSIIPNPPATIAKPQQTSSSTTVLTQNIIGYLIKSKNDEQNKEDYLFQSMASLVSASENSEEASIAAMAPNINVFTESIPDTPSNLWPQVSNNNDDIKPEINILKSNIDKKTSDADFDVDIKPKINVVHSKDIASDANTMDDPQKDTLVKIKEEISFEEDDDTIAFYV